MRKGIIRPLVICLFHFNQSILVTEFYDEVDKKYYYRPIGGGIEFGESSIEALEREVREEIGAEIYNPKYLGMIENIFAFKGEIGHEIVIVYDAAFEDTLFYMNNSIEAIEDNGSRFKVVWVPLHDFLNGNRKVVPKGLMELIQNNADGLSNRK